MFRFRPLEVGLLATSVLFAATPARAEIISNTILEISSTLPNPCTGEDVFLSGEAHSLIAVTENNNSLHILVHANLQGVQGVGLTSGVEYTVSSASNGTLNGSNGQEETFVVNTHLIAGGSASNEVLETRFHFTITPNGDVTVSISEITIECRGAD